MLRQVVNKPQLFSRLTLSTWQQQELLKAVTPNSNFQRELNELTVNQTLQTLPSSLVTLWCLWNRVPTHGPFQNSRFFFFLKKINFLAVFWMAVQTLCMIVSDVLQLMISPHSSKCNNTGQLLHIRWVIGEGTIYFYKRIQDFCAIPKKPSKFT